MTSSNKKILLITDKYNIGGVTTVSINLAMGLKQLGYEPILVSVFDNRVDVDIPDGIEHICISSNKWHRKLIFPLVFKIGLFLHCNRNCHLIVSSKDYVNIYTVLAQKIFFIKTPLICNSHINIEEAIKNSIWRFDKLSIKLCRYVYPFTNFVANVSRQAAQKTQKFFNLKKVYYLPNPVLKHDHNIYENPFSYPDKINILACGRLTKQKNYPLMLNAFALALNLNQNIHLTILGDGADKEQLESLTCDLDIEKNVTFKGFVDNSHHYMQHATCLWLTSLYEGFGMVLVEALSQGCPIVSVDCPDGPAEIIQDNKYGLLVPSYKPEDHARAILDFIDMPKKEKSFYQERVKEFDIIESAKKYLELVKS